MSKPKDMKQAAGRYMTWWLPRQVQDLLEVKSDCAQLMQVEICHHLSWQLHRHLIDVLLLQT